MSRDEIEKLKALERAPDGSCWYCKSFMRGHFDGCPVAAIPRLLEERERLLEALRSVRDRAAIGQMAAQQGMVFSFDQAVADAIRFAEAPASKEGQVCGFVVSEDWRARWTCGKPAGHEGPHSGTTPPAP